MVNKELVALVHLSSYYAWEIIGSTQLQVPLDPCVYDMIKVTPDQIQRIIKRVASEV